MRYLCYFMAGIILILGVLVYVDSNRISGFESELARTTSQRDDALTANKQCTGDVQKQNAALASLQVLAQKEHQDAINALAAAEKISKKYDTINLSLNKVKRTGNECKDAFSYIDAYIGSAQ